MSLKKEEERCHKYAQDSFWCRTVHILQSWFIGLLSYCMSCGNSGYVLSMPFWDTTCSRHRHRQRRQKKVHPYFCQTVNWIQQQTTKRDMKPQKQMLWLTNLVFKQQMRIANWSFSNNKCALQMDHFPTTNVHCKLTIFQQQINVHCKWTNGPFSTANANVHLYS